MLIITSPVCAPSKGLARIIREGERIIRVPRTMRPWKRLTARSLRAISDTPIVFNWGVTDRAVRLAYGAGVEEWLTHVLRDENNEWAGFNNPVNTQRYSHKLEFFRNVPAHLTVPHVFSWDDVPENPEYPDGVWLARTLLNSHGGNGIEFGFKHALPQRAKLYTKYTEDRAEYRVHFAVRTDGTQLLICKKRAKFHGAHPLIRVLSCGWAYCYNGALPRGERLEAINNVVEEFVNHSGLDYGALDVIWDRQQRKAMLLEFNAAPGINHSRVQAFYRDAFDNIINEVL